MREGGRRGRVGQVVRRDVYRLDGCDGSGLGGGDALLEHAHLLRQGGLVSHRRGHTSEQSRYLGSRQGITVDVIDEQQYVPALVAELLGHGQAGQGNPQAVARGLIHLPVDHRHFGLVHVFNVDNTRLLHLVVKVVALPGALTYTGKNRKS